MKPSIKLTEIDNGLFEVIRLKLVELGHYPDYSILTGTEIDKSNQMRTLKDNISNSGLLIEPISTGSSMSRGEKTLNKIIIDRIGIEPATIGIGKQNEYVFNNSSGKYDKFLTPDSMYDINYQISYSSKDENVATLIEKILIDGLSVRKYIYAIKDDETVLSPFWLYRKNHFDTSSDTFIERGIRYEAKYINLSGYLPLGQIAPMTEFIFDIQPKNRQEILYKLKVWFDNLGVLQYEDVYNIGLVVTKVGSEYIISGPQSEKYKILENGELILVDINL